MSEPDRPRVGTLDADGDDRPVGAVHADPQAEGQAEDAAHGLPSMDETTRAFVAMLFDAARLGDTVKLAEFLDQGLPATLVNEKGDSLLMIASYHDNLDATRLLLERGADPEQRNAKGQTPLAGTAFKGDPVMAALLLDHGAAVDGRIAGGKTPLMMAAMFDRLEMVELLLARGADREARSEEGATAADSAKAMGAVRVTERLG